MIAIREPTDVQTAAIQAALLAGDSAREAWVRLNELTNSLDQMDAATFRMLPMVYRNLTQVGFPESELGPLKGIYRQAWYRNRVSQAAAFQVLETLANSGIEPAALKGFGLTAAAYSELALRPMHDIDVLVKPAEWSAAADALIAAGWRALRGDRDDYIRRARVFHALPLVGNADLEVDLHRFMLEESCFSGADDGAWSRVIAVESDGRRMLTLAPEDHVINACVHGVRWDPVPALRWVIDTVMVVRAAGPGFRWSIVEQEARDRGVTIAVGAALSFARRFEPTIPLEVVERLLVARTSRLERWDFRLQQGGDGAVAQTLRYLTRFGRLTSRRGFITKATEFPTYLECMWELERPRQVPAEGVRRVWKRLRHR